MDYIDLADPAVWPFPDLVPHLIPESGRSLHDTVAIRVMDRRYDRFEGEPLFRPGGMSFLLRVALLEGVRHPFVLVASGLTSNGFSA